MRIITMPIIGSIIGEILSRRKLEIVSIARDILSSSVFILRDGESVMQIMSKLLSASGSAYTERRIEYNLLTAALSKSRLEAHLHCRNGKTFVPIMIIHASVVENVNLK